MKCFQKRWGFLLLIFLLAGCGAADRQDPAPAPEPEPGVTTLIYAQISEDGVDREWLDKFNSLYEGEIRIEVRDYSQLSEGSRQGIDLLMTEIAAGKVPDIIELGTSGETSLLPYRQFAEKGYLEDLWPYIENDPDLGRDEVMEAPLKAVEVNGGLYAAFDSVRFHTLIGAESVVGDRTGWTVEELLEAFASMPEEAVILDNYSDFPSMKNHLLSSCLYGFSDMFIDWENGQYSFDNALFRSFLELAGRMPDEYEWRKNCATAAKAREEHIRRIVDGMVMLEDIGFGSLEHLKDMDFYFGQAALVGYPVGSEHTGSYFRPLGIRLAMSSVCQNKEAAWKYIRKMYLPRPSNYEYDGIPVNKTSYERKRNEAMSEGHATVISGELIEFDPLTRGECQQLESLYNSTTRSSLMLDKSVRDIVLETAGAYFAGDKTLDQTVQMIDNRVGLYLNEQR